jgi:hypothetical protein
MTLSLILPLAVALVASYSVMWLHAALPPRLTAWLLVLVGSATAISGAWLVVTLSIAFLGQQQRLDRWFGWCDTLLSSHDVVSTPLGVSALAVVLLMAIMAARTMRRYRRAWQPSSGDETEIVDEAGIIAHAIPARRGRAGTVVVSTGLIAALDPHELQAVVAHERAHLEHRHHRFLAAIDVAASIVPLVRPLRTHIRLATERWADEDAAAHVRSRRVVATAVARAALATVPQPYTMAMSGSSTVARVNALLLPASDHSRLRAVTVTLSASMAAGALLATTVQVHHALGLFSHLCS